MDRRRALACFIAPWLEASATLVGAQPEPALPLVVFITTTEEAARPYIERFRQGMRESGQVEGRTFRLNVRYSGGDTARYPALIRGSLVEHPAVLVVVGLIGARDARDATTTVPIVVATGSDLVDAGIVKSHARPGGNITGVSDLTDESAAKRLELLKSALPNASRVALLVNPDFPATPKIEARVETMARSLGITITRVYARDRASMMRAVDSLEKSHPDALLVGGDPIATTFRSELIDRASALRIPVIHYWPGTAEHGAILSLQADIEDNFQRAAGYVDRILKGAKPAELPIHQPTRYELVINLKAANALGLMIPQALLLRADKVIR
jgi:putative ABC transport system substrate-binding protein